MLGAFSMNGEGRASFSAHSEMAFMWTFHVGAFTVLRVKERQKGGRAQRG